LSNGSTIAYAQMQAAMREFAPDCPTRRAASDGVRSRHRMPLMSVVAVSPQAGRRQPQRKPIEETMARMPSASCPRSADVARRPDGTSGASRRERARPAAAPVMQRPASVCRRRTANRAASGEQRETREVCRVVQNHARPEMGYRSQRRSARHKPMSVLRG